MPLVLDGTNGVSGVDGTASNPAIEGTDSNTGIFYPAADTVAIGTGGTERLRVDSAGNLGLVVTPSAWISNFKGVQVKSASLMSFDNVSATLSQNGYYDGAWKYINSASTPATIYDQVGGVHKWYTAPSGTAGNAITFTQAMTLYASGNLSLGNTTDNTRLHVTGLNQTNGTAQFTANSAKGTNDSYVHYGTNGDWYIRSASASGNVNIQDTGGNVGIGTSSPATLLHVNGTIRYTNRPAAGTITAIGYDANGDLKNSSSSLRYKYDIEDYSKGLDTVMQLRPVSFKFNGEERANIGFIAEEVDALGLPEVMLYNEEEQPEGVLYANMVSLLTKAIQELNAKVEALEAQLKGAA